MNTAPDRAIVTSYILSHRFISAPKLLRRPAQLKVSLHSGGHSILYIIEFLHHTSRIPQVLMPNRPERLAKQLSMTLRKLNFRTMTHSCRVREIAWTLPFPRNRFAIGIRYGVR